MDNKNTHNSIAQNIKKYRLLNNLTQKEMAELLYLDTQYYAQLERGERNFSIEKISMVCSLFHIGIEKIIEIEKETESQEISDKLVTELTQSLGALSYSQLLLTKKFLDEIIPYIR